MILQRVGSASATRMAIGGMAYPGVHPSIGNARITRQGRPSPPKGLFTRWLPRHIFRHAKTASRQQSGHPRVAQWQALEIRVQQNVEKYSWWSREHRPFSPAELIVDGIVHVLGL